MALAGIMGGERSGIHADGEARTEDIFLECAYFSPLAVAGRARRFGLFTDASQRYERGVDFALQAAATERATALLLEICGVRRAPSAVSKPRPPCLSACPSRCVAHALMRC